MTDHLRADAKKLIEAWQSVVSEKQIGADDYECGACDATDQCAADLQALLGERRPPPQDETEQEKESRVDESGKIGGASEC